MIEDTMQLNFLAGVQVKQDIYFSAWNINGLFKYNPELDQCDFLKIFPGEENWGLHSEAILYQNTIWFIPRASERIAIVELNSLDIGYLNLPEYGRRPEGHIPPIRMRGCYADGESFLYLLPYAYKLFIKIDMDKREMVNIEDWGGDDYARAIGVRNQDKLIVYINHYNEIREINVSSDIYTARKIGNNNIFYSGIQNIGENILLFPRYMQDGIVLFNRNDNELKTIQLDDSKQWYYEYQTLINEREILLIPYDGTKGIQISIKERNCFIKEFRNLEVQDKAYCSKMLIFNDEIWYLSHVLDNPIICYEKQTDTIQYRHIAISWREYNEDVMENMARYGEIYSPLSDMKMIYEHIFLLDTFIQFVKVQTFNKDIVTGSRVGEQIYDLLI